MAEWTLEFDGLYEPRYRPNGVATYGFRVLREDALVHEGHGVVVPPGSGGSANVAEFGALLHGLTWLDENGGVDGPLHVRGDSRLVVETVAGRWNLTSERLLPLRDMARRLVEGLGVEATFEKVPRDANAEADALSRRAYREALREHPEWARR